MFSIIVAIGKNNEIGKDGVMPWHLPEDLKYFKRTTENHKVVMGKNTFYSIPFVLPNRKSIVLTRDKDFNPNNENVDVCRNFNELVEKYQNIPEEVFIGGGANVYTQFLPLCKKLYLTKVLKAFDADTYFPEINYDLYRCLSKSDIKKDEKSGIEFQFEVYEVL